ncbi:MAG TPA: PhoH family protein [Candidatus Cloacimonetes bacterium]|nr:PhoH family protein [Candidatus Cloacimonadota bacterium]
MEQKIFVLDTNVLIHNPRAMFSFADNHVVIPIVVIEEIDQFKKGLDEKGRNARQIGRYLDDLRQNGALQDGVPTDQGGIIQVTVKREITDAAANLIFMDRNDNLIIGTALYFKKQYPDKQVVLVSKDVNVRIKADTVGIRAENFETGTISFDEFYTGWTHEELDAELFQDILSSKVIDNPFENLYPNQYVRVTRKGDGDDPITLRYDHEKNTLHALMHYRGDDVFGITARNFEQEMALDLLLDDDVKLVSLSGKAGTGKTLLAIAAGLKKVVDEEKYKRLVVSRPISPLGKDLGYLPGSKAEKFNPWMQPIYDNMDILLSAHEEKADRSGKIKRRASIDDLLDFGFLELEPLTYIRGRSLPDQFMIIDEAQNLSPHEMKTIITRAGMNTKIVLTGDPYQIDIPYLDAISNGLSVAVEKLKGEGMVGHMTLDKGERSALADLAAKYF